MTQDNNKMQDREMNQEALELLKALREVDGGAYKGIVPPNDLVSASSLRCVQWGINPETGERICIRYA